MLYARHISGKLGSDYTVIAKDLKTFRGIAERVRKGVWPLGKWEVYACTPELFYKDKAEHELVGEFTKTQQCCDIATLVNSLSSYVSGDDVDLDRPTFLRYVADRIIADLMGITNRG